MDWKYMLSLNTEELKDEEKDELYTAVTWFEFEKEQIDLNKLKVLLRVSQDILKYKGEQVETLLHELEEMAIKQGEEEARKQESDTEHRSTRSRKSSSLEYENLEQKYLELKSKQKKVVKNNEKKDLEISKLSNKVKLLEQENRRLQNELQNGPCEMGSESDTSETKEQQKQLVESLQNKNKQISDLLRDIEEVEKENFVLREKLSKVKEELSVATEEMTSMTKTVELKEETLKENKANLDELVAQNNDLKKCFDELQENKHQLEREFKQQLTEMDVKLKALENDNKQKAEEIKHLRSLLKEPSVNSSISSLPKDDPEQSHVSALQRALADREKQLLEVRTHLQIATKEMEESTELLQKLKSEKQSDFRKIGQMQENITEMKKLLDAAHERSQNLQEELSFAEENARSKEEELKVIYNKMRENGQVDLVANLQEIQELKYQNRTKQKQIVSLVKTANKLQDSCDKFERENYSLRDQFGLAEEDKVDLSGFTSKMKKMKKEMDILKVNLGKREDQHLQFKTINHKLNQTISSLANQLLELGHKPAYDNLEVVVLKDDNLKNENKALSEENEALRKGMHEILNSINIRNSESVNEIKSETFEKLLRALDVKHISGWYHPAMRLQAELHNLEGVNSELRDQLRQSKKETEELRAVVSVTSHLGENIEEITTDIKGGKDSMQDSVAKKELGGFENPEEITVDNIQMSLNKFFTKDNIAKDFREIDAIQKQLLTWFGNLFAEKSAAEQKLQSTEQTLDKLEEEHKVLLEKLKILLSETDDDKAIRIDEVVKSNVSMRRQLTYLENEVKRFVIQLENLREDSNNAVTMYTNAIGELERKNKSLETNLLISRNFIDSSVDSETHKEVTKALDDMTIQYRELAAFVRKKEEDKSVEMNLLLETQKSLESDKLEFKDKLTSALSKLAYNSVQTSDEQLECLSQKLAESEVKEITERQRANHTNNLYDLVREQLNKSEERFQEFAKYNEDLLKKNLVLQEHLKEAENKICDYVDNSVYNQLQKANNDLLTENERLTTLVAKLEEDVELTKQKQGYQMTWNNSKEQELLNLKHQVVDLISLSDEKVTIAQLNGDILQYRQSQNHYKNKCGELNKVFGELKQKYEMEMSKHDKEKSLMEEKCLISNKTIGNVRKLFNTLKLQYLGSVPLCSEQIFLNNIKTINKERHESFLSLHKAKLMESEATLLKEQLKMELDDMKEEQQRLGTAGCSEEYQHQVLNWMKEKRVFQINELRYRRQSEFKEAQLHHFVERVNIQDDQIARLDEELLMWHKNYEGVIVQKENEVGEKRHPEKPTPVVTSTVAPPTTTPSTETLSKSLISIGIQTSDEIDANSSKEKQFSDLLADLSNVRSELSVKEQMVEQLKSKITEHEMTISMFRKQIGDKQSQISFYERHIMELQNKKGEILVNGAGGDNVNARVERTNNNEELLTLTSTVKSLQDNLKLKEEDIVKYQTLLKVDRDKHSLAAATLQEELQNIQRLLAEEQQKNLSMEQKFIKSRPNRAALEQYMSQVHALEKHTSELHTKISSLEAQLQSTREEVVRWRTLANDRLSAMEELRKNLDNQHKNELEVYKSDSEKLKELGKDEASSLRQLISKQKIEGTGRLDNDIQRVVNEKDEKIHELTIKLRQLKSTKKIEQPEMDLSPKISDLEASRELLMKENDMLKRRYEQVVARERNSKDEIRELKTQLSKKPNTARSDKSDRSIKDQLQKKISVLENELTQLKQTLTEQIAINETHKVQANEDFDKWKKMKHWQQSAEKLKNKLKERDAEFEKLQQTNTGYRMLIERLEREKHNLENRIRTLKSANVNVPDYKELELLRLENMKLIADLEALKSKLEMQQHHSGGLGAAMMQEKLESQERKIAILEVAAKGTVEVRTEIERLQAANSNLLKTNMKLEAENLDLKLDLEQTTKETPHLHQQIEHLENYIDVLKAERSKQEMDNNFSQTAVPETQNKVSELERTVFILKRVVEKLQVENKRLVSGKRPLSDRSASADKLKRDHLRLKEKYTESIQKLNNLEQELSVAKNKIRNLTVTSKPDNDKLAAMSEELSKVRGQLEQKSSLLDKVKILLHRAAAKEKSLIQEIAELKNQRCAGISPIPEESEGSSSSEL